MGNELTMADMALVQAAVDEANASLGRALAVIENAAARLGASPCRGCDPTGDDGACAGCRRAAGAEPCGECQGEEPERVGEHCCGDVRLGHAEVPQEGHRHQHGVGYAGQQRSRCPDLLHGRAPLASVGRGNCSRKEVGPWFLACGACRWSWA